MLGKVRPEQGLSMVCQGTAWHGMAWLVWLAS